MSRHYVFGWEAFLPGYDPLTDHEKVCGVLYPQAACGGGASAGDLIEVWLYANRTKARRIAERLERHYGVRGELRRLGEDGEP